MASKLIVQKNGSITLPTGAYGVFQSYTMTESQSIEDVTSYLNVSGSTTTYGAFAASGTPTNRLRVNGFALVASTTSSPGWGAMTAAGSACTVTFDTTSTVAGTYIVESIEVSHSRPSAAARATWSLANASDLTIAWAAT